MSRYVEAPNVFHPRPDCQSIFLAGGITGQPDWQGIVSKRLLADTDLVVLNPRREAFPFGDKEEGKNQIAWEYEHFQKADAICFWFPPATLCPIALFELGLWLRSDKTLFVGTHVDYRRRFDVEVLVGLIRSDIQVFHTLGTLVAAILEWQNND